MKPFWLKGAGFARFYPPQVQQTCTCPVGAYHLLTIFILSALALGHGSIAWAAPSTSTNMMKNSYAYDSVIIREAQKNGVPPALVYAVIHQESRFNPNAVSPVGAQGLMQLMPGTAKRFGVNNAFNAHQNIRGGVSYLAWLLKRFKGDVRLTLAGYNAGEGKVDQYKGIPPYKETRNYVKKVMGYYQQYAGLNHRPNRVVLNPVRLNKKGKRIDGINAKPVISYRDIVALKQKIEHEVLARIEYERQVRLINARGARAKALKRARARQKTQGRTIRVARANIQKRAVVRRVSPVNKRIVSRRVKHTVRIKPRTTRVVRASTPARAHTGSNGGYTVIRNAQDTNTIRSATLTLAQAGTGYTVVRARAVR